MYRVLVAEEDFDVGVETARLRKLSHRVGGINIFVGSVRDNNDNKLVTRLHLEHYPGMTEKQIQEIIQEAAKRWHIIGITVIHRVGDLEPGEQIVFVGVASTHRREAFNASEFIIDFLKTQATFWKKEKLTQGTRWLETNPADIQVVSEWKNR